MISFTSQVSSGAGPLLVGLLEQATGNYESPFLVTAGITLAAAVVVLFARPVRLRPGRVLPRLAALVEPVHADVGGDLRRQVVAALPRPDEFPRVARRNPPVLLVEAPP